MMSVKGASTVSCPGVSSGSGGDLSALVFGFSTVPFAARAQRSAIISAARATLIKIMFNREPDIKAPDGFLLGGKRIVRKDGTILFQDGWWQAPKEWAGCRVWVHCTDSGAGDLEVAPPGETLWSIGAHERNIFAPRTDRPDVTRKRRH
jgi:hypothetical protein